MKTQNVTISLNAAAKNDVAYGAFAVITNGKLMAITPEKAGVEVGDDKIARISSFKDLTTSNQAGFAVLAYAARYAARVQAASKKVKYHFTFRVPNKLVVNQMTGEWKIKDPQLRALKETADKFLSRISWSVVKS